MYNEFLNKSDLSILDYMEELGKKALHIYFFLKILNYLLIWGLFCIFVAQET